MVLCYKANIATFIFQESRKISAQSHFHNVYNFCDSSKCLHILTVLGQGHMVGNEMRMRYYVAIVLEI